MSNTEIPAETVTSDIDEADAPERSAFIPPHEPKYDWGIAVRAVQDLLNDGSYPDQPEGALLVVQGTVGEIVRVGHIPEANNLPIYLVEFPGGRLVGCLEDEIEPLLGPRSQAPGRMD